MTKYEIILYWSDEDQAFIAEVPELAGCAADGASVGTCARRFSYDNAAFHAPGNQKRSDRRNSLAYPARRAGMCAGTGRRRWADVCPPQARRGDGKFQADSRLRKLRRPCGTARPSSPFSPIRRRPGSVAYERAGLCNGSSCFCMLPKPELLPFSSNGVIGPNFSDL